MADARNALPVLRLLVATMLFALGPALLKLLMEQAGDFFASHPGAISFCNVLFVGNLCAGLVVLAFGGVRRIAREITDTTPRLGLLLAVAAVTSAIYPALLFTALEQTSVINVVLLSRFNGIVYVLLAFLVLGAPVRALEAFGYGVMALGVAILVLTNSGGMAIGRGDLLVLAASLFFAITEILSRKILPGCSVPTYLFVRNFFSSCLFFVVAISLYGAEHFMDAFRGDLWIVMLAYAAIAIVAAQAFWLSATPVLPVPLIANVQLLNPVFSIAFAFLLLRELPQPMQWLVIAIVAVGMAIPKLRPARRSSEPMNPLSIDTGLVAR